ncbi:hypothetical protein DCAR_0934645 [Daucus carota subsp. sativus]|uniref:X8 domain-containing protein n=1 Tax=Daucus carota subsp. sativus TaxID=79200 RepID=A0A175YHM7_DAUCS|nr:hypothetical protein DCAR_0934645 [Daucus carota subsp. sativus]
MAIPNSHLCCIAIFISLLAVSSCEQSALTGQKDVVIPPQTWCVAADGATIDKLQGFIDFSCGGKIDCLLIQPGQACYEPNNPRAHASWCLDAYYRTYKTCDTLGTIVYIDPSYGDCLYI